MKRREFLMLASATAFAKQSLAEETKPTIGVLAAGVPSPEEFLESFREGLRDRGYIEGQNIQFDVQSAEGHADRLPELAATCSPQSHCNHRVSNSKRYRGE